MDSVYAKMKRFKWMELRFSRGLDMMDDDIMHLVRLRLTQGVDAIHSLDAGIRIDPGTRRLSRLKNRGKFVLKEAKLKELVQKIDDSLGDLSTLLNEISQEYETSILSSFPLYSLLITIRQMLAEIKLQNSLLQKIADGTCVHHESTSETRAPAEAARDGDPLATLTRPSAVHLAGRPRSSSSSFT